MKKLNNKGFGIVEVLLLIVIIGIIGGVSYYVYNSQKKTNTALDNAANSQTDPQKSETKPTTPKSLVQYQDTANGVSFYYPADWEKSEIKVYKTPISETIKGTNFGQLYSATYVFKKAENKWYAVESEGGKLVAPYIGYTTITSIPASTYQAVYGYTGEGGGTSYYAVFTDGTSSYMIELPTILEETDPNGLSEQEKAIAELIASIKLGN